MKAEKDDMPEYLKRKKKGPWRAIAVIGLGSAITTAVMITFGKPIVIDIAKIKEGIHIGGKPVFERQELPNEYSVIDRRSDAIGMQSHEANGELRRQQAYSEEDVVIRPTEPLVSNKSLPQKQTVFNDRNYAPRASVNTAPSKTPGFREQRVQQESKKPMQITVIGEEKRLRDNCPWKVGSIEHRECKMRADLWERNNSYSGNRSQY